jgi:superfamily I DNA/RNA helicase
MDELSSSVVPLNDPAPAAVLVYETLRAASAGFGSDLPGFLAHVSLCARESEGQRLPERIALLTFHAAKGLEFPVVFIAGAEEGITPGLAGRAHPLASQEAEERRLFYVALTRARDMLFITHCARRRVHGEMLPAAPSRFVADLPARCRTDEESVRRPADTQLSLFG